jgi:hypothetical protein
VTVAQPQLASLIDELYAPLSRADLVSLHKPFQFVVARRYTRLLGADVCVSELHAVCVSGGWNLLPPSDRRSGDRFAARDETAP